MKSIACAVLLLGSSLVGADQLDLSIPDYLSASQVDAVKQDSEIILLARHPQEAPFKNKKVASSAASSGDQLDVSPKKVKSVFPSILACGLLGMSLYGDSAGWRAGSAALCGVSLAWYNN